EGVRPGVRAGQRAIRRAAAGLKLPAGSRTGAARDTALRELQKAAGWLDRDGAAAEAAMKDAADALNRLADATPPVATRLAASRPILDAILSDQNSATVTAEQVLRGAERLPADAATFKLFAEKL